MLTDTYLTACMNADVRLSRYGMIEARGHLESKRIQSRASSWPRRPALITADEHTGATLAGPCQKNFALMASKRFSSFPAGRRGLYQPNDVRRTSSPKPAAHTLHFERTLYPSKQARKAGSQVCAHAHQKCSGLPDNDD